MDLGRVSMNRTALNDPKECAMSFLKTMCRAEDLKGDGTRSKDVLYFNSQVSATQQGTVIAALKTPGDTKLLSSEMKTSGQRWYREAGNVHEPAVKVSIANTPKDARFDKILDANRHMKNSY